MFWQHTAFAEHWLLLPTPTTVMGEQSSPTGTSRPCRTMPSSPRSEDIPGSLDCCVHEPCFVVSTLDGGARMGVWLAFCTDWQHWMLPVEHELAGSVEAGADAVEVTVTVTVVGSFHGMATARTARDAMRAAESIENISGEDLSCAELFVFDTEE